MTHQERPRLIPDNIEALVAQGAQGDPAAISQIVESADKYLRHTFLRRGRSNPDTAQEAVQKTLFKLLSPDVLRTYTPHENRKSIRMQTRRFGNWVFTIAANETKDAKRQDNTRARKQIEASLYALQIAAEPEIPNPQAKEELKERMLTALDQGLRYSREKGLTGSNDTVRERIKAILALRLEGKSNRYIEEELGVSSQTVKTDVNRAREIILRDLFPGYERIVDLWRRLGGGVISKNTLYTNQLSRLLHKIEILGIFYTTEDDFRAFMKRVQKAKGIKSTEEPFQEEEIPTPLPTRRAQSTKQ